MASVNKVILIGNLGADPETKYLPSGDAVTTIRIATTDKWKDKTTGEKKEATEWHRIVMYGRMAEAAGEFLVKGSQVFIEGSIHTRKWQDKDGQDRYTTEIKASLMQFLDRKPASGGERTGPGGAAAGQDSQRGATGTGTNGHPDSVRGAGGGGTPAAKKPGKFDDMEDDIPF